MSQHDLIIRQARVPTAHGFDTLDLAITGTRFSAISPLISESAAQEIDASQAYLLPGIVDAHVHFNQPGRSDWEGFSTGSHAFSAGGGTTFIDMPLNSSPPVLTADDFRTKRLEGERDSLVDFALWGGLTPSSIPHLPAMAKLGAVGFKAFLCDSGLDEFPLTNHPALIEGMKIAAQLNLPVAVHAEDPDTLARHQQKHPPPQPGTMEDWCHSRPIRAELDAIEKAIAAASSTGAALHIVHVSCPEGIQLISQARLEGIRVTAETCPHYLLLSDLDASFIGPSAKCAPPLRPPSTVAGLWQEIANQRIDTIGSDHSPAPPDHKTGHDLFSIWGGIAGIQHGFLLLLDSFAQQSSWHHFSQLTSEKPAHLFRLPHKGKIALDFDADFFLVQPHPRTITTAELLTRHPLTPYLGLTSPWTITHTFLRGQAVSTKRRGLFLQPSVQP